jgi:hypothetical protein
MLSTDFGKCPNIKLHENPFRSSRVVPWGQMGGMTDRHDETFRNFVNALKSGQKLKNIGKKECDFNTLVVNLPLNTSFCSHM